MAKPPNVFGSRVTIKIIDCAAREEERNNYKSAVLYGEDKWSALPVVDDRSFYMQAILRRRCCEIESRHICLMNKLSGTIVDIFARQRLASEKMNVSGTIVSRNSSLRCLHRVWFLLSAEPFVVLPNSSAADDSEWGNRVKSPTRMALPKKVHNTVTDDREGCGRVSSII